MATLRILILSDGRPGHFNLSEGIAAALERLGPATTTRQDVRRGRWSGAALAGLTRAHLPASTMLAAVYGLDSAEIPPSDVIVSSGAETLAANIWLARARCVPNVFYGSLRLYDPTDFALVLTSYARNANRPRHALALKPSRFDPDGLADIAFPMTTGSDQPPTLGLLIGGDAGPIRFNETDWNQLFDLIPAMARDQAARWIVANSRRTPDVVSDRLAAIAAAVDTPICRFLDARTAPPGTLPGVLAASAAVLCTANSSSMLSESIWARRPTLALAPRACPFSADEATYRSWLDSNGWCRQLPLARASPDTIRTALTGLTPLRHNPVAALADVLRTRIPALEQHPI